ncbi:MAG: hypothetical protein GC159_17135 [Phycisphaera sp.]|nr:hypothetical protein [Phycisphaera sp.]
MTQLHASPSTESGQTAANGWVASFGDVARLRPDPRSPGRACESLRLDHDGADGSVGQATRGPVTVVLTGELYDRDELCHLVDDDAHDLSDAHLVAALYRKRGRAAIEELKGVYAVVVHDAERRVLLARRDTMGVTPLFYARSNGVTYFATSLRALLRCQGVSSTPNRAAIADHLWNKWPIDDETFYEDIRRVPAAHLVRSEAGRWALDRLDTDHVPRGDIEWDDGEAFDEAFTRAVRRCAGAGRVGVFLSGGLDSISVASTLVDLQPTETPLALSLTFPTPDTDESAIQRHVAATLGVSQTAIPLSEAAGSADILSASLETVANWPTLLSNFWLPAYRRLAEIAREQGCDTVLTGNGGDEWLGVTPELAADLIRRFHWRRLAHFIAAEARSFPVSRTLLAWRTLVRFGVKPLAVRGIDRVAPGAMRNRRRGRFLASMPDWLAPDPALRAQLRERLDAWIDRQYPQRRPRGPYGFYLRCIEESYTHPLHSMEMEDAAEMTRPIGLRLRHPYWDPNLIRVLVRTRPESLMAGGRAKGLIRDRLDRRFPNGDLRRQRKNLSTVFATDMIQNSADVWLDRTRGLRMLSEMGIVDTPVAYLRDADSDVTETRRGRAFRLWALLNAECWLNGADARTAGGENRHG